MSEMRPSHHPKHTPPAQEPHVLSLAEGSTIKKVIGVASGKGGVGKSFVTSTLAVALARRDLKVGILDADITGPSVPASFGLTGMLRTSDGKLIEPMVTKTGIKVVSVNLVLQSPDQPVIWRGPVLSQIINQFWSEVDWGELDVLLIDMPPGTGDVPLTIFQSIPVDGLILVATAQDLASMIVKKARNMATMMDVKILGMAENMAYLKCPHCGEEIPLFGDGSAVVESADEIGVPVLDRIAFDPEVTKLVDSGRCEGTAEGIVEGCAEAVTKIL